MKMVKKKIAQLKLLVVSISLIVCSGCATTIKVHLIDKEDFMSVKKGTSITADRDGYFISQYGLDNIVKAKIDEAKK